MTTRRRVRRTPNVVQSLETTLAIPLSIVDVEGGRYVLDPSRPAKGIDQPCAGRVRVGCQDLTVSLVRDEATGQLVARLRWSDAESSP